MHGVAIPGGETVKNEHNYARHTKSCRAPSDGLKFEESLDERPNIARKRNQHRREEKKEEEKHK